MPDSRQHANRLAMREPSTQDTYRPPAIMPPSVQSSAEISARRRSPQGCVGRGSGAVDQVRCDTDVGVMPGRQMEYDRPAQQIGDHVDFRAAPATRDAIRLCRIPRRDVGRADRGLILRLFFGRLQPSGAPSHKCCRWRPSRRCGSARPAWRTCAARACARTIGRQQAADWIPEGTSARRPARLLKRL